MRPENFRLLIHHHHPAHVDADGVIWLSATLGRWIEALGNHFAELGLLLYETQERLPSQVTPLTGANIRLHSLGPRRSLRQRLLRPNRLPQICAAAAQNADGLLIRGITPHQYPIWRSTLVRRKAFLLVESLEYRRSRATAGSRSRLGALVGRLRQVELDRMAAGRTLLLGNSPVLVSEMEAAYRQPAYFAPTNSLRAGEFSPLSVRPVVSPWKLLFCGRLDRNKGLSELIEAVAALNRRDYPCRLDIAAGLDTEVYPELLALARRLQVEDCLTWHGFVPYGPELFTLYRQADAFVLPSYSEGFPHAIWEAMAHSCPVIATRVGGIPALVEDQRHALLIPPHDTPAIAAAVTRLLMDDPLREMLITAAYHHSAEFTVEACAEKLARVLAQAWKEDP